MVCKHAQERKYSKFHVPITELNDYQHFVKTSLKSASFVINSFKYFSLYIVYLRPEFVHGWGP